MNDQPADRYNIEPLVNSRLRALALTAGSETGTGLPVTAIRG